MNIIIKETRGIKKKDILALYEANEWSSAQKPDALYNALVNSDTLISAWDGERLVGIGNAITDGYLVVFYPHLLVLPEYHGQGIGRGIMDELTKKYAGFHQQVLIAEEGTTNFYQKCGFEPANKTQAMWIYLGDDQ